VPIKRKGSTALHIAIFTDRSDKIIEGLLDTGGKDLVLQQNNEGNTALYLACKQKSPSKLIRKLTDVGGGRDIALILNAKRQTAYDIACEEDASDPKIIEFLLPLSKEETLFLGKYRIPDTHAIHKSATSVVMKGECTNTKDQMAVKFITKYEHYKKEHDNRERVKRHQTDENERLLLVPIIDSFNSSEKDVYQGSPEASRINESLKLMNYFDWEGVQHEKKERLLAALAGDGRGPHYSLYSLIIPLHFISTDIEMIQIDS
jgi:hypothetical protein